MFKKIILFLITVFSFILGFNIYNSYKTVECWWGTLYPSLSFVAVDEEPEYTSGKISSIEEDYIPVIKKEEKEISFKFAILEWFKEIF